MRHRRPAAPARHGARAPEERSLTAAPRFIGSFPRADVSLTPALPEVALIGRSNVGKSSLLNALASRRIAKVSGTPGKTRMMNVFEMPLVRGEWCVVNSAANRPSAPHRQQPPTTHHAFYVLDLPGYGWARTSKTDRAGFRRLLTHVLDRPRLAGVLWLLDIRREPSDDDRAMQELFAGRDTRVLAALTKSDVLARAARTRRERELQDALELDADQVIATSARERAGIEDLREAIASLLRGSTAQR
jgi:GTP-binding protein